MISGREADPAGKARTASSTSDPHVHSPLMGRYGTGRPMQNHQCIRRSGSTLSRQCLQRDCSDLILMRKASSICQCRDGIRSYSTRAKCSAKTRLNFKPEIWLRGVYFERALRGRPLSIAGQASEVHSIKSLWPASFSIRREIPHHQRVMATLRLDYWYRAVAFATTKLTLKVSHLDNCSVAPTTIPSESLHCLLYTSPSPRDGLLSRMPSSA